MKIFIVKKLQNSSDAMKMDIIYLLFYRGDKINVELVNKFNGVTKVFILLKFF